MNQYNLITNEIRTRIRTAWGTNFQVSKGRPKVPFESLPYAVINCDNVSVVESGRTLRRRWRFEIVGAFAYDESSDSEPLAFAKIDLLHQALQPYSEVSVPSVPSPFAGICDVWQVEEFGPIEEEVQDAWYGCRLVFTCETEVFS